TRGWAPAQPPKELDMEIRQVVIKLPKETLTVPAIRVEGGLALHRDHARPAYWTISHVPSGLSVWDKCARGKADALVRFDALLSITDWDRPKEDLLNEPDLYNRIRVLQMNPPSAPRRERKHRPPLRIAKRSSWWGEEFETPVWWEGGGLAVEGDPTKGITITHEPSGLRVVKLPRGITRAKSVRLTTTFLAVGTAHGMDWNQKNPFPPSGAPQEIKRLVKEAEQGNF